MQEQSPVILHVDHPFDTRASLVCWLAVHGPQTPADMVTWKTPRWKGRIETGNTNGALARPVQAGGPACGQQKDRVSASVSLAAASHKAVLGRGDSTGKR